jgi:tetratricopeptide (TPR) repeat protein
VHDSESPPIPEAVTHLWKCVKKALAANEDPSPRRIERMATSVDLELAASTVAGWFETWSVVPAWEKFDALIKALAAEHDEDWRSLHRAALIADRQRKREERRRKKLSSAAASVVSHTMATDGQPDPPPHHNPASTTAQSVATATDPAPAAGAPAALRGCTIFGDLHLHQAPAEPTSVAGSVPRQLPADVAHFTGRDAELAKLDALLTQDDTAQPATTVISALVGSPGVGKTALVMHWAHRARDYFPDGQLFVNLRGYDPGPPMTPEQVLEDFLRALDVAAERIPAGLEARAGLYRSMLHGRRVLIVLDNANSAKQVRPLLPGSPTCQTVVTSRSRLAALIARDGASRITVDLLSRAEAITLLRNIIGDARVTTEFEATAKLASQCAYLPLALRIAAERAVAHAHTTLADLTGELAVERDRLDVLAADDEEDETTAVRAVFSWSYHALPPEAARAFRLLGLHAGPEISAPAAAALTNTTPAQARRLLESLVGMHLIEQTTKDRYRFHDLLRVYAAECAEAEETDQDRRAAVRRALTWYLYTGDAADRVLNPHRHRIPLDPPREVSSPPLEFTSYRQALDWCEAERVNLVAATRQAAETREYVIAWKLPLAVWGFFTLRRHWADLITTHQIGLAAARHLHDRKGESWTLGALGFVYFDLRRHEEAFDHYQNALPICQEIGDQWCEAIALLGLSRAYRHLGNYEEALSRSKRALRICEEIDDPWSQTLALLNIGTTHRKLQRFQEAIDCFHQALTILCPVHDRSSEAMTLQNLGTTYRDLKRFEEALEHFQRACSVYRKIGDRGGEAHTLRDIGDTLHDLNQMEEAAKHWRQALAIFEDLGDWATAARVRASLMIRPLNHGTPTSNIAG